MTLPTRIAFLAALAGIALTTAGCSSRPAATTSPTAPASASPSPKAAAPVDAKAVLAQLATANIGVTHGIVQDENSDPNNLMGRPHQYTSRASFDLPGGDTSAKPGATDRGGSIEVFTTAEDAKARYDYIDKVSRSSAMFAEYHYLNGTVVVRVAKNVKPGDAAKVGAAVAALRL